MRRGRPRVSHVEHWAWSVAVASVPRGTFAQTRPITRRRTCSECSTWNNLDRRLRFGGIIQVKQVDTESPEAGMFHVEHSVLGLPASLDCSTWNNFALPSRATGHEWPFRLILCRARSFSLDGGNPSDHVRDWRHISGDHRAESRGPSAGGCRRLESGEISVGIQRNEPMGRNRWWNVPRGTFCPGLPAECSTWNTADHPGEYLPLQAFPIEDSGPKRLWMVSGPG
jgi:hypothetical protein